MGRQVEGEFAPVVLEYVPAEQGVQAVREEAPVEVLKVPAGQSVGLMEERGQNDPAGQRMGIPLGISLEQE